LLFITAFGVLPRSYARTGVILRSNIVAFVVMLVAGWIGTIQFGMYGTVAAMLLSQYIHAYIQLQSGRRDIGLSWKQFYPWKKLLQSLAIAVLSAILPVVAALLIPTIIGRLVVCVPLYGISYIVLLYITGVFDWVHDPAIKKILDRYLPFISTRK
jgi:hypothetical protein